MIDYLRTVIFRWIYARTEFRRIAVIRVQNKSSMKIKINLKRFLALTKAILLQKFKLER